MNCPGCNTSLAANARFCGACGTSLGTAASAQAQPAVSSTSTTDLIGRDIAGRYRIRAMLGAGGMGAVFRAEQISLKRTVALKLLKDELCEEPGIVRRFNAEAELAAKLNHPNTVTLFDFGQDSDGTLFIAMEYVQGVSLRELIAKGPMSAARAVGICEQVASSLADAHAFGIVHRDLKPDNVMLSERGKKADIVTVLDFGIAKLRDRDDGDVAPVTQAGDLLGTPQYMAPEQIRGETVDGRTDIYALGAMMYEMLTGRVPFSGKSVMQILSKQLSELPRPMTEANPSLVIDRDLETLIMSSLQKDPVARPQSMDQVGDKLAVLVARLGEAPAAAPVAMSPSLIMGPTVSPSAPIRPPGVPFTPDSFPHQMPQPPAEPMMTPAPAGGMVTHGNSSAPPLVAAPARRSPMPWVLGAVAVCALVAGGIAIAVQSGGANKTAAKSTNDTTKNDGSKKTDDGTKPTPTPKPTPKPKQNDQFEGLSGSVHSSYDGYELKIPPGYSIQTQKGGTTALAGFHNGTPAAIVVQAVPVEHDWTKHKLTLLAKDNARRDKSLATLQIAWQQIQGKQRLVNSYVMPNGNRVAAVIFVRGRKAIMVAFMTKATVFTSAESLVKELVERRFRLK